MERKLAHVESIEEIREIRLKENDELAQNISMYRVLGWWVVGKRGEFNVGQKVIYIEIDSKVPSDNEYFSFLESKGYKVKTMKLNKFYFGDDKDRTVVSQGLLVPMSVAFSDLFDVRGANLGDDVTDILKIVKIEDETKENKVPRQIDRSSGFYHKHYRFFRTRFGKWLKSKKWFQTIVRKLLVKTVKQKVWPFYITKTDEDRIQNRPWVLNEYAGQRMIVTEKLDGTSSSYGLLKVGKDKFDFAVCSRNVRQLDRKQMTWYKDAETNFYWEMADKYDIENFLKKLFDLLGAKEHVYIQGETIGPSIQGNKYKLMNRELRLFNLVVDGKKINSGFAAGVVENITSNNYDTLKWVPILDENFMLLESVDEMVKYATANSTLLETLREGIVIRDHENTVSFKVISPEFLVKWGL